MRLQVLQVQGPPTRVGARGSRKPGQLVELAVELVVELLEELVEELVVELVVELLELVDELVELEFVVEDFVREQDEQRT